MEFTYKGYESLINNLKNEHYNFSTYQNYSLENKTVILRHDIDISIEKAFILAELEQKLGVCSTYFILLRSDLYNPLNKKNIQLIEGINKMGHQIGLHFDETLYLNENNIPAAIEKEVSIFSELLKMDIDVVSMHRPSQKTLEANYTIANNKILNSYSDLFFKQFKYVSDSKRRWRENIDQIIESKSCPLLLLLTHPIWYNDTEIDMWHSFSEMMKVQVKRTYDDILIYTNGVPNELSFEECVSNISDF